MYADQSVLFWGCIALAAGISVSAYLGELSCRIFRSTWLIQSGAGFGVRIGGFIASLTITFAAAAAQYPIVLWSGIMAFCFFLATIFFDD